MHKIPFFTLIRSCILPVAVLLSLFVGENSSQSVAAQPASIPRPEVRTNDSGLLETGSYAPATKELIAPMEIKLVSYNIRWRGGEDLRRLIALLRDDAEIGRATIIGLQEVDRRRKRTDNVNTAI